MRKITKQIVEAFIEGRPKSGKNTSTDGEKLYLHGNCIAEKIGKELHISNAGWFSTTTKERLNGLPHVSIYQSKGRWYLNGVEWDGKWQKVGFYI